MELGSRYLLGVIGTGCVRVVGSAATVLVNASIYQLTEIIENFGQCFLCFS
jgi:hypothetical protein